MGLFPMLTQMLIGPRKARTSLVRMRQVIAVFCQLEGVSDSAELIKRHRDSLERLR